MDEAVKKMPNKNRENTRKANESPKEQDFEKLMQNVVFVLSGFENPQRGQLRDKAVEMGARYKADWGPDCTHLM